MEVAASSPRALKIRDVCWATVLICLIVAVEYGSRHYLMFWLPTIGTPRVNDMLSLLCAYTLLGGGVGVCMRISWGTELNAVGRALRDCMTSSRYTWWIVAAALSLALLPPIDRLAWARLHLPLVTSSVRSPSVWLAGYGPLLRVASVIFVNGLYVPLAEEFLWRGVVQVRLSRAVPLSLAVGITAASFSLKHVVVDASFGRFLTIAALGVIFGLFAHHFTWRASAALHILLNMLSSVAALAMGRI